MSCWYFVVNYIILFLDTMYFEFYLMSIICLVSYWYQISL